MTDEGGWPALVALHGLPGSVRDFRYLGPVLGEHLRFVRIDLPGFGGTPTETLPGLGLEERADLVVEVLDALQIERAVVLGHSMGGPVATALAVHHPDRVVGLALLAAVGPREHRLFRALKGRRLVSAFLRVPPARRAALPVLRKAFARAGFPASTPDEVIVRSLHLVAEFDFVEHAANLDRVSVPVLVAWTLDDPYIEADIFDELAAMLPDGPRLTWEEGGHNLQKTHAVELGEVLCRWIPELFEASVV